MKKLLLIGIIAIPTLLSAQKKDAKPAETKKDPFIESGTYSALKFRSIGPALTSGRISDIAVNPRNKYQWYIAVACGNVWKTDNAGNSFYPIFDNYGSYSVGCVTIDPNNPNVIWVGTGENNNQRSVAYGDGVYKSEDGGKSFKNVGLKTSEHIGRISVNPKNSNEVFVAAYGPLWSAGGERGVYKTSDGGKTWERVLFISDDTGVNDVLIDPNNTNIIYAAAHQRRRHEWTYISGGPESAIHRSTDGGKTWEKLAGGLPGGDVGRIGLAISPVNSDHVYAIIEAGPDSKGTYRSTDRGASWEKRSGHSTAGNYYTEIFCDPKEAGKLYSMDFAINVSTDGGKSFRPIGEKYKHVDNHAIWVDPDNTDHILAGCDGGLYETHDGAKNWKYFPNLPITQFYKVTTDNALPFYNVYGGTQDNNSQGGPSRTLTHHGIMNSDWFITVGGDGFESQVDPKDPNIVYSQWQYGGLIRFDRKSGEVLDIKPVEKDGEPAYRWNWDAPLFISNFDHKRIYFAANKLFRSDDQGQSWKTISGDLSRQIDRNKLPVMGKVWSMDAVAKNQSTSIYGNITAFYESPKNEKLLYVGTDDGLVQTTTDGGATWNKTASFPGAPDRCLVHAVAASQHDENVAYAVLNNHRSGDFKPYIMKTADKGKSWTSISSNLPVRGSAYCISEDHKNPNLLFVGTDFGVFFTLDGGKNWTQLKAGLPTTCIRDMDIQKRENDLVLATFGRGFYILDDYSPLQNIRREDLDKQQKFFPVKDGLVFIPSGPIGHRGKSFMGEQLYTAENPPIGATITYWLGKDYKTIKDIRKEAEAAKVKASQPVYYPSADSMRLEDREEAPYVLVMISDDKGNVVRKLNQPAKKGMYRLTWDGRTEVSSPVSFHPVDLDNPYAEPDKGYLCLPGKYTASLHVVHHGKQEKVGEDIAFNLVQLNNSSLAPADKKANDEFYRYASEFRRVMLGTNSYLNELMSKIKFIKSAITQSQGNNLSYLAELKALETRLINADDILGGDASLAKREFEVLPGILGMAEGVVAAVWSTTTPITETHRSALELVKKKFATVYSEVRSVDAELTKIEQKLENIKAPYTPGRLPSWSNQ